VRNRNKEMKHQIKICMGSSCFARGNQNNLETLETLMLENKFECDIELTGSRCENRCSCGPNIEIDGQLYNRLDNGSLIELINKLIASDIKTENANLKEN